MIAVQEIQKVFRGHLSLNEPLNKYTSFRIGGPADYYMEPLDKEDLVALIGFLQRSSIPLMIMGNGTNLLVSDEGVRGAVVNFENGLNHVQATENCILVEAGVRIGRFVDFCIQQGLRGVEMLAGIPGTLGGALVMNAGAYGGEISDYLVDVEVFHDGRVKRLAKEDAGFSYRRSALSSGIVLGATFQLPKGDKADLLKRRRELLIRRNQSQPLNLPNSGSVFKNPEGTFAAKLIEEAGLKGTVAGRAQISEKHANFIVNMGGARAADVVELMMLARRTVKEKFTITLEPEVKLIGFPETVRTALLG